MIKKKRGLANVSPERRKEIARMGGKASPNKFKENELRAVELGRKGGKVKKAYNRS